MNNYPQEKLTIIGAGIIGALEAYYAYLEARSRGQKVRVTIHDKNKSIEDITSALIHPSLTPDEILSVVPRGKALYEKLKVHFSIAGGIGVDDVPDVNDTRVTEHFKQSVEQDSLDEVAHANRTDALLAMGKLSMNLWQLMYRKAVADGDKELIAVFDAAHFNPCREPQNPAKPTLHDGYRIDLIYGDPNAEQKAERMKQDYKKLGYAFCDILSPAQVMERDPSLRSFCDERHTQINAAGERVWKPGVTAIWRPGGSLNTREFLPKFYAYLTKVMGKYKDENGHEKNCFKLKLNSEVTKIFYDVDDRVHSLGLFGGKIKTNHHYYSTSEYVFCPGEAVGTLRKLGLDEPDYAGFAGAVLTLNVPISPEHRARFEELNHCMEVHSDGVVLAWQARFEKDHVSIGVGGTKAYYGDQEPALKHAFSQNRNLLQLQMMNDVMPEVITLALKRDTRGQTLTAEDLQYLVDKKIAVRHVGRRAVAFDGYPTFGAASVACRPLKNARVNTHWGSGGVSFGHAAVCVSRAAAGKGEVPEGLGPQTFIYGDARRKVR